MTRSRFPVWPVFADDEVAAAARVPRSGRVNYWTGEEGRAFEQAFARACGCRYGIALANGSVALELALHALGVGPGDDVVVPPRSFIASASSVVLRGARPVFADVDGESQTITAEAIRAVLGIPRYSGAPLRRSVPCRGRAGGVVIKRVKNPGRHDVT